MSAARAAAIALLAVLAACGDGVPRPEAMLPASEEQARAIAADFIDAMAPCDDERLDTLFDSKHLVRHAMQKAELSPKAKKEMIRAFDRRGFSPGRQLCNGMAEEASLELLRIRRVGDDHRPLLRLVGGTFNYFDLEVGVSKRAQAVVIVDLLDYYGGQHLSDLVAESAQRGVAFSKQGLDLGKVNDIAAASAGEDWARVRELLSELPAAVRAVRMFRVAELNALMHLDDPAYVAQVEAFERDFPDDPALLMLKLDQHFMKKDVKASLATLDRIDRKVGGDPYLDQHRAQAYLLDPTPANLVEAERLARVGVAAVPHLADTWWALVNVQVARRDHAGVAATLDEIEERFEYELDRDAMASDEYYGEFPASPEFAAWWAKREARGPGVTSP